MKQVLFSTRFRTLIVLSLVAATVFALSISKDFSSSAQKLDEGKNNPLSGTITGTVYVDHNMNGVRETSGVAPNLAIDAGIAGVTVTAYDGTGVARGSGVSGSNGAYTINALGTGPYRLEFTTLPSGYQPSAVGTNNASTIKFVADGASAGNDLGIVLPGNYCQTNPFIAHNVYNIGPAAVDTIVRFPYNYSEELDGRLNSVDPTAWTTAPSRTSLLNSTGIIDADSVGATFGITYDGRTSRLFSATYLKRGANFGTLSNESTGAIYVTNNPTGSPTTSTYVDLNAVFGAGTAGANPHPISTTDFSTDNASPTLVGKRGLGGLKLSANGASLYTVNLNDRRLYVIPTSGALNSTTITRFDIPTTGLVTSGGNCNAADVRPFAVGRDGSGQIYVGAVCSAESEANDTKVHAFVWRFTGSAFTLVANNTLTFARNAGLANNATWLRWDNTSTGVLFRSSPMLTDIEFDGNDMMLGFRDRYGDMTVLPDFNRGYGDLMRVCNVSGTFTFESNATCGSSTSTDPGGNNNTGNGGREFYTDLNGDGREEGGWGGLTQVPGYNHVVTTFYDPVAYNSAGTRVSNFYTGGVQRYNNSTGAMTGAYDVFLQDSATGGNFGKSNGAGDAEVLCDAAPLQIGNRIWRDTNANGAQDPGEPNFQGITVRLWADTNTNGTVDTQVGTAITDVNGNYLFGGVNNTNLPPYSCGTTPGTVDVRVNSSADDAEQQTSDGVVVLNNADLDFFGENNGAGTAYSNLGVRFNNLTIPQGATITNAFIEFTANNSGTVSAGNPTYTIQGQNVDNAATFAATANDISGRAWLSGQDVTWTPGAWSNATTTNTSTPSLTNIVQAIVNRGGWAGGNSMAFRFTGTSTAALYREAEAWDDISAAAPRLVVQYTTPLFCTRRIEPTTAYEVRLDNPANFNAGGPLNGLLLTRVNETSQLGDDDSSDSDAFTVGNPSGSPAGNFPVISLTTGGPGANNHRFDVGFAAPPTAANVSVEGRVTLAKGNGVRNAFVILTEADGTQHTVKTGSFGYYRFDDIEAGQTVVVSISSKRFTFNPSSRVVTLTDSIADLDFIAQE